MDASNEYHNTYFCEKIRSTWLFTGCNAYCLSGQSFLSFAYEPRHEISNNLVCATSKTSDQPAHSGSLIRAFTSPLNIMSVKLLTEHHLEFLSLTRGCTGLSESTLVKMSHC